MIAVSRTNDGHRQGAITPTEPQLPENEGRRADWGWPDLLVHRSRVVGLVLIALVLSTVAFSSQLRPQLVAGVAQAAPVSGPPAVGACVPQSGTMTWNPEGTAVQQPGSHAYLYPQLDVGPCAGVRYGEVASVIADPSKATVTVGVDGTITAVTDSNSEVCRQAALRYVGWAIGGSRLEGTLSFWNVAPAVDSVPSRASARQEAVGQHWLACIVYLRQDTFGGVGQVPPSYDSSLRSALLTGYDRDQLGNCVADADFNASVSTVCRDPHRAETFGFGTTGPSSSSRAVLIRSCTELITRLTRLPDISAAGTLAVELQVSDSTGQLVATDQIPPGSDAVCGLNATGGRQLAGSLIANGAQPIRWTG